MQFYEVELADEKFTADLLPTAYCRLY